MSPSPRRGRERCRQQRRIERRQRRHWFDGRRIVLHRHIAGASGRAGLVQETTTGSAVQVPSLLEDQSPGRRSFTTLAKHAGQTPWLNWVPVCRDT